MAQTFCNAIEHDVGGVLFEPTSGTDDRSRWFARDLDRAVGDLHRQDIVLDFLLDHGTCPILEFLDSRAGPGQRAPNPDDD